MQAQINIILCQGLKNLGAHKRNKNNGYPPTNRFILDPKK
jgi:hypothetical protein